MADTPDFNHPDATGVGPVPLNNPNGIRLSTALGYLNLARHRLNLTIRPNCTVHRLLFEGKRVTGVQVESGGETFVAEADEIVLSSGTIGSPHILLLSGVGPAEQLAAVGIPQIHELPGVGQSLRDHPIVFVPFRTRPGHEQDPHAPRMQVAARWTATGSPHRNDLQILMGSLINPRYLTEPDGSPVRGLGMYTFINLEEGAGELRITSPDPYAAPSIDLKFFENDFDLERCREVVRIAADLGRHPAFGDIIEGRIYPSDEELESDEALNAFIRSHVVSGQHLTSTCRMGPSSDPAAVVDQQGRVHGHRGPAGGRCLHHAQLRAGQHQLHYNDDRRAHRRLHPPERVAEHGAYNGNAAHGKEAFRYGHLLRVQWRKSSSATRPLQALVEFLADTGSLLHNGSRTRTCGLKNWGLQFTATDIRL